MNETRYKVDIPGKLGNNSHFFQNDKLYDAINKYLESLIGPWPLWVFRYVEDN